jgi:glycosyltransferase involved in cell wall biosynthesis
MLSISVIIPCHNATRFLEATLASVRAQTYASVETILVNDGSDNREDVRTLEALGRTVSKYIEQPHLGLPAARNAGIRAASSDRIVLLDADDLLEPAYISECVAALDAHPDVAFVYTDYRVIGDRRYTQRLNDYNLFELLDRNTLTYAALLRKAAWALVGGYDESMRLGYEDWDFWLRMAEHGRFGFHLPKVLFKYRSQGASLFARAELRGAELRRKIRANHPRLYSHAGRERVKAIWAPAVCLITTMSHGEHTISDVASMAPAAPLDILQSTTAPAFLIPAPGQPLDCHSAELCAIAIWGDRDSLKLPDGSLCVSRSSLASSADIATLATKTKLKTHAGSPSLRAPLSSTWLERVQRHFVNAELLSAESWRRHPLRALLRLIPLRAKEWVNRFYPAFDLSFYLKFRPNSLVIENRVLVPLRYSVPPSSSGRQRVALFTPHLGLGGAETVLLHIAGALDRDRFEIALIATQSHDGRWTEKWKQVVDHVYDLAAVVTPEKMIAGIYSLVTNWKFDAMLVQNSLAAYSAISHIRRDCPSIRVIDLHHATDSTWDILRVTAPVAGQIDLRVAISEAGLRQLHAAGTPVEARLIRNGIDLQHFRAAPIRQDQNPKTVLFAGRLAAVKRPTLLVDIAREWIRLGADYKLRIVVAGDGPESGRLFESVRRAKLETMFQLLGVVDDIRPLLEESDIVVVPSRSEGIPLIVLEAFASQRPVVCSKVGAVDEAVDGSTGVLVETGADEARRFAEAIHSLLEDPRRREEMGKAGRRQVEQLHDLSRCQTLYQELFEMTKNPKVEPIETGGIVVTWTRS